MARGNKAQQPAPEPEPTPEPRKRGPKVLTDEHKEAISAGRTAAMAVRRYLEAVTDRTNGRHRHRDPEELRAEIRATAEEIANTHDPLRRLRLVQQRQDLELELDELTREGPVETLLELQAGFIEHAAAYSANKGIRWPAWRELGVSAAILKQAGIQQTRT